MLAGFVDAIAGGGGLIAVPALLSAGLPPVVAFGTNKVQSVIGTLIAAFTYWRGLCRLRGAGRAIGTFAGSVLGAFVVKQIDTSLLQFAVPVALIVIALYFAFAPSLSDADRHARLKFAIFVPVMGFVIGFYDGLFGPGHRLVPDHGLRRPVRPRPYPRRRPHQDPQPRLQSRRAGAVHSVGRRGLAAIAMAIGAAAQAGADLVGGYLGAMTGIRFGAKLIRPLVVIVSVILALRLLIFR